LISDLPQASIAADPLDKFSHRLGPRSVLNRHIAAGLTASLRAIVVEEVKRLLPG
jgi:hypothetical protein